MRAKRTLSFHTHREFALADVVRFPRDVTRQRKALGMFKIKFLT